MNNDYYTKYKLLVSFLCTEYGYSKEQAIERINENTIDDLYDIAIIKFNKERDKNG